jgi:hypothetical protein
MERHTKDKKHSFKPSKYADRWGTKEYKEDQDPVAKRAARKRWRNTHRRESSWVSVSTPLEDLVSLSPRMKISRRCLFAFHVDDKYSKLFDDSSDEKGSRTNLLKRKRKLLVLLPFLTLLPSSRNPLGCTNKNTNKELAAI